jgi:hypothetical protein
LRGDAYTERVTERDRDLVQYADRNGDADTQPDNAAEPDINGHAERDAPAIAVADPVSDALSDNHGNALADADCVSHAHAAGGALRWGRLPARGTRRSFNRDARPTHRLGARSFSPSCFAEAWQSGKVVVQVRAE